MHSRCRMVLCTFYVDAFEQHGSRQASVVGIYMGIAGASREEYQAANSRYLLALVPKTMDLHEAIRTVIVHPMQLLERGFPVQDPPLPIHFVSPFSPLKLTTNNIQIEFGALKTATDDGVRTVIGSVYSILGDHPSQAEFSSTAIICNRNSYLDPMASDLLFGVIIIRSSLQALLLMGVAAVATATSQQCSFLLPNGPYQCHMESRHSTNQQRGDPSKKSTHTTWSF